MEVTFRDRPGYVVVRGAGRLTPATSPLLRDALLRAYAEQPPAVVCDLEAVTAELAALEIMIAVADQVAAWPACPILIRTQEPALQQRLRDLGIPRRLPLVSSMDEVAAVLSRIPAHLRATLHLSPTTHAPSTARGYVARCLQDWGAVARLDAARVVGGELVTNAALHAGTDIDLHLFLQGKTLAVAVADRSDSLPAIPAGPAAADGGHGLILVEALSDRWGVLPRRHGGKVVWAVLRDVTPSRRRLVPRQAHRPGPLEPPGGS